MNTYKYRGKGIHLSEKIRRGAHGGADPYADVIQLIRSRIISDENMHAELIAPYWENWERMYGLFSCAEAFARHLVTRLAEHQGIKPEDLLHDFALKYAELPPDKPPTQELD